MFNCIMENIKKIENLCILKLFNFPRNNLLILNLFFLSLFFSLMLSLIFLDNQT